MRSNFNRKGVQNMHKYLFMNAFFDDEDELDCLCIFDASNRTMCHEIDRMNAPK